MIAKFTLTLAGAALLAACMSTPDTTCRESMSPAGLQTDTACLIQTEGPAGTTNAPSPPGGGPGDDPGGRPGNTPGVATRVL